MRKIILVFALLASFSVFADDQKQSSLVELTSLIQSGASSDGNSTQNFISKYGMVCSQSSPRFISCDLYLDEETFPHIMLFLNNANNLIAYVTLDPLPYKKKNGAPASKCQAIGDYPKLCYLSNSTEAERNKISYYYATMMRSAN